MRTVATGEAKACGRAWLCCLLRCPMVWMCRAHPPPTGLQAKQVRMAWDLPGRQMRWGQVEEAGRWVMLGQRLLRRWGLMLREGWVVGG